VFSFFERLINPYPEQNPKIPPRQFFAFVWQCTEGVRGHIALMSFFSILFAIFEAGLFAMLGKVVDWLSGTSPQRLWQDEGKSLLLLAVIIIASTGLVALQSIIKHQALMSSFPMRVRWNFHRLMLNQSMSFFQDEFAGRIATKVLQTALAVRDVCLILTDIMVFIIIYFATMVFVVGSFDSQMLWPFLAWLVLYIFVLRWFVPRLGKVSKNQADARSVMSGRITDAYTNITTVKLFSHSGREAGYARSAMNHFLAAVRAQMRLISGIEIVNHILSISLVLSSAAMALWLWTHNLVGVGAVAASTAMALRLNGTSHWIMWEMTSLFENIGTVQDGIQTLSKDAKVVDQPDAPALVVTQGEINFEQVNFGYDKTQAQGLINQLSFTIKPGEKIGLVGRSGAGKSTLINLLLRFYDVNSGRILIDDQSIAEVSQESLRSQIGMVTQDTSLLHRSIRENILYGRPDATDEEMIQAAKQAEAHDFIMGLSDNQGRRGYDVMVGDRGIKLSGGQRQRIAIARVILKDAPLLLLDEATSALDSEVEHAIQTSLYQLMEGKTVVAIAHRLSTIAAMDRLIVLDKGQIIEQGSHQELLARQGVYAQLWLHQSGGFLQD